MEMGIEREKVSIYFAGPLFTLFDRESNRGLVKRLRALGYVVILPQEIEIRTPSGALDYCALAQADFEALRSCTIVVANLDGADTDSGTAVEVGLKLALGGPVLGWRTDFRGCDDHHWNAMFNLCGKIIYSSSLEETFDGLVKKLDNAIIEIIGGQKEK